MQRTVCYCPGQRSGSMFNYARLSVLVLGFCLLSLNNCLAQGLHFSQFYQTPLLISPAYAGLMPDKDYRVSGIYRTQWGAVSVPFHSASIAADGQMFRNKLEHGWLGIGGALFTDNSGDGNLTMMRFEGFAAYHQLLGEHNMISVGLSAAGVTRSVDFGRLTFDAQWDGFAFDTKMPNLERNTVSKTNYTDVSAGAAYAFYPNEALYMRFGVGLAHLNSPKETFLQKPNEVGLRPSVHVDVTVRIGDNMILNPAVYYTTQKSAYELLYGALAQIKTGDAASNSCLIAGVYHRWSDAVVAAFGYEWKGLRIMSAYDYTISDLGQYINHNGALEIGLSWHGLYGTQRPARIYACPRF